MKQSSQLRALIAMMLLFMTASAAAAANRFFIDPVNIEPGETVQLLFQLENETKFYGFQADIALPKGLSFLKDSNDKAEIRLSDRCGAGFSVVSNLLNERNLRVGAFSTSHAAITGNQGSLIEVSVLADADFDEGELSASKILFIEEDDTDVELPNFSLHIGNVHSNSFYIPNFPIAVGETKEISILLENETPFTAFQTDLYLPEGLTYVNNSESMTSRASSGHTLSAKLFEGRRVRFVCFCTSLTPFVGNTGALVSFKVTAEEGIAETSEIKLQNSLFSMQNSREYKIPDSPCEVTSERVMVESIVLNTYSEEIKRTETYQIYAEILPHNASNKELTWKSSDEDIASVSSTGLVTALKAGETVITAKATDGSDIEATCRFIVISDGNESDNIDRIHYDKEGNKILISIGGLIISPTNTTRPSHGIYLFHDGQTLRKIKI